MYRVEPNDENDGIGYNYDENVGEDIEGQEQPSYPDFSSYFTTNEVYIMRLFLYLFVFWVLLLSHFFQFF